VFLRLFFFCEVTADQRTAGVRWYSVQICQADLSEILEKRFMRGFFYNIKTLLLVAFVMLAMHAQGSD
jgi:hypothetical protein